MGSVTYFAPTLCTTSDALRALVAAGMTQSAVARFEAGGTVPSLPVLERLSRALDADLIVQMTPRTEVVEFAR